MSPAPAPAAEPEPTRMPDAPSPIRKVMLPIGHFLFRFRNLLFPLLFLPLAAILEPAFMEGDNWIDDSLDALGVIVLALGLALRSLVVGLAYIKRGGKDKKVYADALVTDGIFAHSRNPLYLGNILILCGLAMIHSSPWFYLVGLPFLVFAYLCIVVAEETFLSRKFGESYADYVRRTNRFFPSTAGLADTIRGMRFDWKRVIRKEYGTLFGAFTGIVGLLEWEDVRRYGFKAESADIRNAFLLWIPVLLLYVTARILKKKKLLEDSEAAGPA